MTKAGHHFDSIASSYDEQLPLHIREYLLLKKTRLIVKMLKKYGIAHGRGLDAGCGTGWYVRRIAEYGYAMTAIDSSAQLVEEALRNNKVNGVTIQVADMRRIDCESNSFDFIYCINSLHHLHDRAQFLEVFTEMKRVLKPGGLFIIHELNAFFLFRMYLNYIFPLTNKIDRLGGENWIMPKDILRQDFFNVQEMYYYTFFPHIIPRMLFGLFCRINSYMERISLRKIGVHYMAVLKNA